MPARCTAAAAPAVNGLDPEGIRWIRTLMRSLAAEGRTVFVSSHLMPEMESTADHLIVIGRGSLIADCSMALLGQLVIAVLGALAITSEYSTGMIRTSLTVMPGRGVLYGAKAAVFAAVTLVIAVPASFLSFFIGQALLTSTHTGAALSEPNVLRAVIASALYVTLCGLFAFGLGAILRNTAGAITAAYGFLFLIPQLAKALPGSWYADTVRWLPGGDVIAE
jgi:hypothetical protein